ESRLRRTAEHLHVRLVKSSRRGEFDFGAYSLVDLRGRTVAAGDLDAIEAHLTGKNMTYVLMLPKRVPVGKWLVHNQVRSARNLGSHGFRAWLSDPAAHPASGGGRPR